MRDIYLDKRLIAVRGVFTLKKSSFLPSFIMSGPDFVFR